jgi:cyclopropane-fatty-acyl-phospholipid synthase
MSLQPSDPRDSDQAAFGGSRSAIRHHYDVGNAFFRLWLDASLTYSSAMWTGSREERLETAQRAKLDYHLDNIALPAKGHLLDIGCGWGALLRRARDHADLARGVGLTLSNEQARHVAAFDDACLSVETVSWTEYTPHEPFDGIISIGAFEHFAHPRQTEDERLHVYRSFFRRCSGWLKPGGALSLQTIIYGSMDAAEANAFITNEIFPGAELPRPHEIFAAADQIFEVETYRNDRLDYARTCESWYRKLRQRRDEAIAMAGKEVVEKYERYLMLSAAGFRLGRIGLVRLKLVPLRRRQRTSA